MRAAQRAVGFLLHDIERTTEPHLPPLRELSRRYGISLLNVREAALELRSRGILRFSRGTKIRIVGRKEPDVPATDRVTAAQRIYDYLRAGIQKGEYRTGEPLPKQGYIAAIKHVSTRTVTAAYSRLVEEGLVHSRGKVRIVGPDARRASRDQSPPKILVVMQSPHSWMGLCQRLPLSDFARTFEEEAQKAGVKLVRFCTTCQSGPGLSEAMTTTGATYAGALVVGSLFEIPDVSLWIGRLLPYGKPVVWFDRNEEGAMQLPRTSQFTRVVKSERLAVRSGIDYLAERGHRHVAYYAPELSDWRLARYEAIRSYGATRGIGVSKCERYPLDLIIQGEPFFGCIDRLRSSATSQVKEAIAFVEDCSDIARHTLTHALARFSGHALAPFLAFTYKCWTNELEPGPECGYLDTARVVWSAMELTPLFEDPPATAVIAANDLLGRSLFKVLVGMGLALPGDVSLISFDNSQRFVFAELTSIDFGFSYLGYQAFHTIVGDIPVDRNREGVIVAPPRVVENGSTGRVDSAPRHV